VSTPIEGSTRVTITRMHYHPLTIVKVIAADVGYSAAIATIQNLAELDDEIFATLAEHTK